jgi:rhodanese-related sulfurtransferase
MVLDGKGLVDTLRSQVNEIDCVTMNQRLKEGDTLLFIDIREEKETMKGYAARSFLLPRGVLEMTLANQPMYQSLLKKLPSAAELPIYLICRSGARSILAAESLQKMGYRNVYSVSGGFLAWQSLGFDIQGG